MWTCNGFLTDRTPARWEFFLSLFSSKGNVRDYCQRWLFSQTCWNAGGILGRSSTKILEQIPAAIPGTWDISPTTFGRFQSPSAFLYPWWWWKNIQKRFHYDPVNVQCLWWGYPQKACGFTAYSELRAKAIAWCFGCFWARCQFEREPIHKQVFVCGNENWTIQKKTEKIREVAASLGPIFGRFVQSRLQL